METPPPGDARAVSRSRDVATSRRFFRDHSPQDEQNESRIPTLSAGHRTRVCPRGRHFPKHYMPRLTGILGTFNDAQQIERRFAPGSATPSVVASPQAAGVTPPLRPPLGQQRSSANRTPLPRGCRRYLRTRDRGCWRVIVDLRWICPVAAVGRIVLFYAAGWCTVLTANPRYSA